MALYEYRSLEQRHGVIAGTCILNEMYLWGTDVAVGVSTQRRLS
jgi:hypothetical protein